MGHPGCISCQKRLRLSWKVDECKPLPVPCHQGRVDIARRIIGHHSSKKRGFKLCWMTWRGGKYLPGPTRHHPQRVRVRLHAAVTAAAAAAAATATVNAATAAVTAAVTSAHTR